MSSVAQGVRVVRQGQPPPASRRCRAVGHAAYGAPCRDVGRKRAVARGPDGSRRRRSTADAARSPVARTCRVVELSAAATGPDAASSYARAVRLLGSRRTDRGRLAAGGRACSGCTRAAVDGSDRRLRRLRVRVIETAPSSTSSMSVRHSSSTLRLVRSHDVAHGRRPSMRTRSATVSRVDFEQLLGAELVGTATGPALERRDHGFDLAPLVEQPVDLDEHRVDFDRLGLPTAAVSSADEPERAASLFGRRRSRCRRGGPSNLGVGDRFDEVAAFGRGAHGRRRTTTWRRRRRPSAARRSCGVCEEVAAPP